MSDPFIDLADNEAYKARSWPDRTYLCRCRICDQQFSGHKRQITCRICEERIQAAGPVVIDLDTASDIDAIAALAKTGAAKMVFDGMAALLTSMHEIGKDYRQLKAREDDREALAQRLEAAHERYETARDEALELRRAVEPLAERIQHVLRDADIQKLPPEATAEIDVGLGSVTIRVDVMRAVIAALGDKRTICARLREHGLGHEAAKPPGYRRVFVISDNETVGLFDAETVVTLLQRLDGGMALPVAAAMARGGQVDA